MAADDGLWHERASQCDADRRAMLVKRIAQNKAWLSDNWHQVKDVRRPCQANLEADEQELARLDALSSREAPP